MSAAVNKECEGKVALVTGASRGIGAAIAKRLAAAGAHVACAARTVEPVEHYDGSLQETVEEITAAGGKAIAVQVDLSKEESRRAMIDTVVDQLGPIDILVNNAAVTFYIPFEEFPRKRYDLMMEVQVWAPYELAQMVVPSMRERGGGHILNISSRAGSLQPGPPFWDVWERWGFSVYAMCKAALDRMSNCLAAELYNHNIAVNSLSPWDNVESPGASGHDLINEFDTEPVEHMAEAALLLCTGDPKQITGRVAYSQPFLEEQQRRVNP